MKKAIIYVFSGTGNTRIAGEMIAEALLKQGIDADIWEARRPFAGVPDPNGYDIAGFGYPIHAFNTPQFFLRFVKTLPEVKPGMQAFIFKTSGEPFCLNNASSWPLTRILRKKGFAPLPDTHLLMPYNIVFRYKDSLAKQMYLHTREMAGLIAAKAADGKPEKPKFCPLTILLLYLFRLQWFGAWVNGPFIHADKMRCTGCGLCARSCPAKNISMREGRPHFSYHCTMCMRCVFYCPRDAVRPGFLNLWRVNGAYPFKRLAEDASVPDSFVNESTRGYFRLFRKYYRRTGEEIEKHRKDSGREE